MVFGMTNIADKVQDFLVYLKYEKQYSSATLKNYSLDYLELDKKQTNITFQIEQVDKYIM